MLKLAGKAIVEAIKGSTAIGNEYNGTLYRVIRSGRDLQDKAFYTELLMNNRAFLQTGYGDLDGGLPTPPGEESNINQSNSYMLLYYPNGKMLMRYGRTTIEGVYLYGIAGHEAIAIRRGDTYGYSETQLDLGKEARFVYILGTSVSIGDSTHTDYINIGYGNSKTGRQINIGNGEGSTSLNDNVNFNKNITVLGNVKANNIPELVLPDHRTPVDTVTIAHHSLSGTEDLPGDGQMGGNCYSHSGEHSPGGKGYWSVGTGDPSGRGFWQNIPIPGNIEDYLDYEVIVNVRGTGDNHPLGIALCSNQGEATFGYARYVQTPSPDDFVDVNFGFVRDFQNRQNSMSIVINAESAQNRYDIMSIRLEKRNHPEGNYTLTAQVTMVNDEPQITYAWVKQ